MSALLLLLALLPTLAAGAPEALVARWRGGSLDAERFASVHDPGGEIAARGGDDLRDLVAKAAYREIYVERARALGLDDDPDFRAELERWRTRRLAALYEATQAPEVEPSAAALATHYESHLDALRPPSRVDLEVLFVRCAIGAAARTAGRARMAALGEQWAAGTPFEELAAAERARSGDANGSFENVPLTSLNADLAAAAIGTPIGELSALVESPLGLFRLRVLARHQPPTPPLVEVEARLRRTLAAEGVARWRRAELATLRRRHGLPPDASDETVFAAGARALGLDREADHVAREAEQWSWILADAAFYRHREILPSDAALEERLAEAADRFRRFRLTVALLDARGDRHAALEVAGLLADEIAASADPAAAVRALGARPGVDVTTLGPLSAEALRRTRPELHGRVASREQGAVLGPFALPVADLDGPAPEGSERGYASLAWIVVEEAGLPPLAEVRDELLEQYRSEIGSGFPTFVERVGRFWEIELWPEHARSAGAAR